VASSLDFVDPTPTIANSFMYSGTRSKKYVSTFTVSEQDRQRRSNPALAVVTGVAQGMHQEGSW